MFSNGKLLADYKDELIQAHGYSEELAQDIAVMADSIVEHYGSEYESTVLDAVASTKVVVVDTYKKSGIRETVHDVLEREGMLEEVKGEERQNLVGVRNIDGIYRERPHISFSNGEYHIDSVERIAVINSSYTPDSPYFLGKLAGELLKAVNSHLRPYEIDGNTMTVRQGLSVRTEKLSRKGDDVTRKFVSETGVGLEASINYYDKMSLIRNSYYTDYDLDGYMTSTLVGGNVLDLLKLRDMVRVAQVTKDTEALTAMFDSHMPEGYQAFVGAVDELYAIERQRASTVDSEELMTANDRLEQVFQDRIVPMMRHMKTSMKLGVGQDVDFESKRTSL